MQITRLISLLFIGLALFMPIGRVAAQDQASGKFSAEDKAAIEEIIRNYLLNNPQVIIDAAQRANELEQQAAEDKMRQASTAVRPVDTKDHMQGNPNATVHVIEYSDFECPFCKSFHPTMQQAFDDYGTSGKIAWVYRHFPLDSIHSKARKEAQASECAAELGGNDAFWNFAKNLFEVAPSNNRLGLAILPDIAKGIGLNRAKFEACLSGDERGGKYADHIEADLQNAMAAGGTGTPYTVVVAANGKTFPINGAMPYSAVKEIIELALVEK
jgi:protein-disulfide isomerase